MIRLRVFTLTSVLFTVTFIVKQGLSAQPYQVYKPCEVYSNKSSDIKRVLKTQFTLDSLRFSTSDMSVMKIVATRKDYFMHQLKRGVFIKDNRLETVVANIVNKMLDSNPFLRRGVRSVLIEKNPAVNARCFASNIYIVNIGLLAKVESEDELAFVLAHEMAHDQLDHQKKQITAIATNRIIVDQAKKLAKLLKGDPEIEDIEKIRNLMNSAGRFNRKMEIEADSLAMIMLNNTGYKQTDALSVLSMLDEPWGPKYSLDADSYLEFQSDELPFNLKWLNDRLGVLHKKHEADFLYSPDSVTSHPDAEFRRNYISLLLKSKNLEPTQFPAFFVYTSEFEAMEVSYSNFRLDLCLFQALQLLKQYPNNQYLVAMITRVFIDLYNARNEKLFPFFVRQYTIEYSPELRQVNNFLYNLSTNELSEVSFAFISRHFNSTNPDHYYLLWKICEQSYRYDQAKKLKRDFYSHFKKDIRSSDFKEGSINFKRLAKRVRY